MLFQTVCKVTIRFNPGRADSRRPRFGRCGRQRWRPVPVATLVMMAASRALGARGSVLRAGRNSPPAVLAPRASEPASAWIACQSGVSRFGVNPKPTVTVRMKESAWLLPRSLAVPVISAVLTPKHFHAHAEHQRFFGDHFVVKDAEAALACLNTVQALQRLAA